MPGRKPTLIDLYNIGSAIIRGVETAAPESAGLIPDAIRSGFRFANGTEAAVRAGLAAYDKGSPDPKDLPDGEILKLLPESEVARFSGDPHKLVDAYKAAWLAKRTIAGFQAQAPQSTPPGGGTSK